MNVIPVIGSDTAWGVSFWLFQILPFIMSGISLVILFREGFLQVPNFRFIMGQLRAYLIDLYLHSLVKFGALNAMFKRVIGL